LRTVLRRGFQRFEVLEWREASQGDDLREFRDRSSAVDFLRPFLHNPLTMMSLRRFLCGIAFDADISRLSDYQIIEQVARQLTSGRFRISKLPITEIGPSTAEGLPEPPVQEIRPRKEEEKTWIEIELVDEENQPVAGKKYRITLADGKTIAQGMTDSSGLARIAGIDPGTCEVTFPDLDQDAWTRAS